MKGSREKKSNHRNAPGVWMVLAAVCLLLTMGGTSGAAASSPVERLPEENGQPPRNVEQEAAAPEPEHDPQRFAAGTEPPAEEPEPSAEEPEEAPAEVWGPVPVSDPVEDTYFDDAVFLGDSRTDGFRLYSGLKHGTFLCATGATVDSAAGTSVDTPLGRMPLLDAASRIKAGRIYIMLGVNELGWSGTDLFRKKSEALLDRLSADHPEAELVIQSLLPVSKEKDAKGSYVNNRRIDAYNEVWKDLARERDLPYVDVAAAFADGDGCLPEELCFDGVHLNPQGCRVWLHYLRTHPVGLETEAEEN